MKVEQVPIRSSKRGCRRAASGFRKGCRSRFYSHLPHIHGVRKNPRTCIEGPFGEVVRTTGPMAKANPFHFSTKYQDDETDLLYYGYRYYNASTGRWVSRDPIEEEGGVSLYGFIRNEPISWIDSYGLKDQVGDSVRGCHCCACVSVVTIPKSSIFRIYPSASWPNYYGHEFIVVIQLNWVVTRNWLAGAPQLIWKEKSNRPPDAYEGRATPGEWFDVYNEFGSPGSTFDEMFHPWRIGIRPPSTCPMSSEIRIEDFPGALITKGPRTLEFEITVKSAPGCPCGNNFREITQPAKQVIAGPPLANGEIATQTFDVYRRRFR